MSQLTTSPARSACRKRRWSTPARLARLNEGSLGVRFALGDRLERDLLIRKLFTGGLNTAADTATAASVTLGLLQRIWTARMNHAALPETEEAETAPPPSLPKATLVLMPSSQRTNLGAIADRCQKAA